MGYTHYWRNKTAFTDNEWQSFTDEVKSIVSTTDVPLAGGGGDVGTKPLINDKCVKFNGVGDDSHETCYITKSPQDFEFCKTARKPYDSVVVDVLKAAQRHNDDFVPTSDGGPEIFR